MAELMRRLRGRKTDYRALMLRITPASQELRAARIFHYVVSTKTSASKRPSRRSTRL